MAARKYYPRLCEKILKRQLAASGAVLVEGAKWCGKTSMAAHAAHSVLYMQDPDRATAYQRLADTEPTRLLVGDAPRLIDEWQVAPVLWDAVRFEVDRRGELGQFILTGSATPKDGAVMHTGTGRIARLLLRPMSLFEAEESDGSVSLAALFDGNLEVFGESRLTVAELAHLICRGGWPEAVVHNDTSYQMAENYADAVIHMDVNTVDNVERNPKRVELLLRSYARNVSTLSSLKTIQGDVQANDPSFSEGSLYSYVNALRRIFVIEDIPAWQPSLRSRTAIRTSDKRQFVDPSIATAVLHATPDSILDDFETFGFLFESLAVRDMRVYAQQNGGSVFHYRDKNGLEADMIVRLRDGRWGAVEVKLGHSQIDEAAKHLQTLAAKVNEEREGKPAFLMVLTGGQFAYRRKDGVLVVPIGCLRD
ncbi:MAG: ATP-binding protein [Bacteroidaceae bacterium]|nr:ATP-binding protein [Bacteroidaceae bacterium]